MLPLLVLACRFVACIVRLVAARFAAAWRSMFGLPPLGLSGLCWLVCRVLLATAWLAVALLLGAVCAAAFLLVASRLLLGLLLLVPWWLGVADLVWSSIVSLEMFGYKRCVWGWRVGGGACVCTKVCAGVCGCCWCRHGFCNCCLLGELGRGMSIGVEVRRFNSCVSSYYNCFWVLGL